MQASISGEVNAVILIGKLSQNKSGKFSSQ
jgi:hypothetical protein